MRRIRLRCKGLGRSLRRRRRKRDHHSCEGECSSIAQAGMYAAHLGVCREPKSELLTAQIQSCEIGRECVRGGMWEPKSGQVRLHTGDRRKREGVALCDCDN